MLVAVRARVALHFVLILFVGSLFTFRDPVVVLFAGAIASLLVYGFLAVTEVLTSPDVLTPLSYHFLWCIAGLGVASIYYSLIAARSGYVGFDQIWYVRPIDVSTGYLICIVGSFVLHCTLRFIAPNSCSDSSTRKIINPVLGLAIFASGVFVIIAPPTLAIVRGLPASLLRYSPLAIMLAIAFGSPHRKAYWFKLMIGTALLIAANMLAFFPYKGGVLQSLFPLVIALWKHKRSLSLVAIGIVPVFYLAVVSPFVTSSRAKTSANPLDRLSQSSPQGNDSSQFGKLMGRVFDPIEVGFIVSQTRAFGFLKGETMKNIEYALVPRLLWPDKPNMSGGKWFTVYVGSSSRTEDASTSTAMTPVGELYWNFALPGVCLGLITLYSLYGGLWILAEKLGKSRFAGALLYTIAVLSINSGEFSGAVVLALGIYTIFLPVLFWPKLREGMRSLIRKPTHSVTTT